VLAPRAFKAAVAAIAARHLSSPWQTHLQTKSQTDLQIHLQFFPLGGPFHPQMRRSL
jgi:hypothetical protein